MWLSHAYGLWESHSVDLPNLTSSCTEDTLRVPSYILLARVLERMQGMSENFNFQRWKQCWPFPTDLYVAEITQVLIKSNQWETPMWHLNLLLIQVWKSSCQPAAITLGPDPSCEPKLSGSRGHDEGPWAVLPARGLCKAQCCFWGGRARTSCLGGKAREGCWGYREVPLWGTGEAWRRILCGGRGENGYTAST